MRVKEYNVLCQAIETGIRIGWARAHKHVDEPDEEVIRDAIEQAVTNEICDWFVFEEIYDTGENDA